MTSETAKKLFRLSIIAFCVLASFKTVRAQDDYEDDNMYADEEEIVNPYKKFIGIGFTLGTNTIVETQNQLPPESGERNVSFDGLFAYGGTLTYSPLDFLILEGTYLYSKNEKVIFSADSSSGFQSNPNSNQFIEICAHIVLRPESRINFFATIGGTYIINSVNGGSGLDPAAYPNQPVPNENSNSALCAGAGVMGNIQTPFGLITPVAEWRLNFQFGEDKGRLVNVVNGVKPIYADVSTFYSIPRFSLLWYPSF